MILFWLAPVALGQPALRLLLLAEHTGCPRVPDVFENSRTTHAVWPMRALAWNMPYHAEHHAYPSLPFHALPRAHALLADRIALRATGYLAVHREFLAGIAARRSQA